jgi:WhiB family transcriptional regulator, redox-sensing transcriptional regulator
MKARDTASPPSRPRPRPIIDDWTWQLRGSCHKVAPEIFFPEDSGRHGLRGREEQAKRICRECPVLKQCREHALAMPETHGIWGAMTPMERARGRAPAAESVAATG